MKRGKYITKKKYAWKKIIGAFLLITLILSVIYSIIRITNAPHEAEALDESIRVKSDYMLMLVQCLLGLLVMAVPSLIEKKWMISIPNHMYILYFVFLYCAIYLGEVRNFYFLIPHWDSILHAFSGAMLGP